MLDLEFLHGTHFVRCRTRIDRRFAGYRTLQFMSDGALSWRMDEEPAQRLAGAWCWGTPHGCRLRYGPADPPGWWEHRYIAVAGPLADAWAGDGLWPDLPRPTPDPAGFACGFDRLLSLAFAVNAASRRLAVNQLERLLLELASTRQAAPHSDAGLAAAIALAGDPERHATVAELARLARLSAVHLRRRFRAATGMPPHRYALEARLRRARALLAEGDLPIKVIAERLGFSDVQHFSRCFTHAVGSPPAAYRRRAVG
jgi:AraC-like DNA-binding protein